MLIDTHAHLYAKAFDGDRDAMLDRAVAQGVNQFLLPNVDESSIAGMLALEAAYPARCFAMMGLHPCSVKANYQEELKVVRQWLDQRDFIAIGEIGIDLYWDKTFLEAQKDAFLQQVGWALELDRPVVIHARDSLDLLIELVRNIGDSRLRGVFHCFTGTVAQANAIMELGFYLGIGGVLTYKNGGLDKTLKEISLDRIILETDAPYLAPVPHRGKRNESAYVGLVADKLASIKDLTVAQIAAVTTANARRLFQNLPTV
jgi:TatD DNase family protein